MRRPDEAEEGAKGLASPPPSFDPRDDADDGCSYWEDAMETLV